MAEEKAARETADVVRSRSCDPSRRTTLIVSTIRTSPPPATANYRSTNLKNELVSFIIRFRRAKR